MRAIKLIVLALAGIFLLWSSAILLPPVRQILYGTVFKIMGVSFLILGGLLIYTTLINKNIAGRLKIFLLITGGSVVGILTASILHNLLYALFIYPNKGDEPVFFIIATVVCPLLFLIGIIGSVFYLSKRRNAKTTLDNSN